LRSMVFTLFVTNFESDPALRSEHSSARHLARTIACLDKKAVTFRDYLRQSDSQVVLEQVGEAAIGIDSAFLHVLHVADALDEAAQTRALRAAEQVRLQADCGYAMSLVRRASERLMDIRGASAFAQSNPLQRAWRDIALEVGMLSSTVRNLWRCTAGVSRGSRSKTRYTD
jgi:alkylation response protein AidB-like acyl-CoA dehydrogenase